jgi:hypothetical protein
MSTTVLVTLLIGVMLITMLTRVFLPIGQTTEGTTISKIKLPFQYRLLYHRTSVYMIGTVMVLGGVGQWMSFALQVVMVMGAFAIISIPVKYHFTTEGVALNNVVFRRWDEFETYELTGNKMKLVAKDKGAKFNMVIPPREQPQVERMISKLIKGAAVVTAATTSKLSYRLTSRPAKKPRRAG